MEREPVKISSPMPRPVRAAPRVSAARPAAGFASLRVARESSACCTHEHRKGKGLCFARDHRWARPNHVLRAGDVGSRNTLPTPLRIAEKFPLQAAAKAARCCYPHIQAATKRLGHT